MNEGSVPKPKLVFVGSQMEVAGAQRVLLSQAAWFYANGYPVLAVFLYDKQGLAEQWRKENPFPIVSLHAWKRGGFGLVNLLRLVRGLWRLSRLLRQEVAIVESFTLHSNLLALPLAALAGVQVRVATHHGIVEGSFRSLERLHAALINGGLATVLVAVSDQMREYAIQREGVRRDRVVVIPNGIKIPTETHKPVEEKALLRTELQVPEGSLLLLSVGRLTKPKGHVDLLDALAPPSNRDAAFVLALAGDGPLRPALEAQANNLGIAEKLRFLGVRHDIDRLLLAADIYVQPSLQEGLSIALLEAMAAGLPVIATAVGAAVDVIVDGESGVLVPPNDPVALAAALEELLVDVDKRQRLGRAGRARVAREYSLERMCRAYETLMLDVLKEHGAPK